LYGGGLVQHIPDDPEEPQLLAVFRGINPGNAVVLELAPLLRNDNAAANPEDLWLGEEIISEREPACGSEEIIFENYDNCRSKFSEPLRNLSPNFPNTLPMPVANSAGPF
jgi:hypothetical protein